MEAASGRGQRGQADLAAGMSATRTLKEIATGIINYLRANPEWSFVLELPKGAALATHPLIKRLEKELNIQPVEV